MTALDLAVGYAVRDGFVIVPVGGENRKNPGAVLGKSWEQKASSDADVIRGWAWEHATGIGVYLPASELVCVDLDDHSKREAIESLGVRFDRGLVARSGSGGLHAYFRRPAGVSAEQWGNPRIDGVEVRANGMQVLPPSRHTSGNVYEWIHQDAEIPELPALVIAARTNGVAKVDASRHGQLLIEAKKAVKARIATMAVSDGRVFTADEVDGLASAGVKYALSDAHVEPRSDGATCETEPAADAASDWSPQSLITLASRPPKPPEIGGLFYASRRHLVSGEYESGKSWLALCVTADELNAGRGVVWVDADDMGAGSILERLRQLGVSDDRIHTSFAYVRPSGAIAPDEWVELERFVGEQSARLVVFDALNPALSIHGLDPAKTPDVERFYKTVLDPFRHVGCAVVALDHLVKNPEASKRYSYGSERKASGAEVHIGIVGVRPFGRGKTGRARLTVHKDRPGFLQRPIAGVLVVDSNADTGTVAWQITPDTSTTAQGGFRPTGLMEKVSRYLEAQGEPRSRNQIEQAVKGKAEFVRAAIDTLVSEQYAVVEDGPRSGRLVRIERVFRESADAG